MTTAKPPAPLPLDERCYAAGLKAGREEAFKECKVEAERKREMNDKSPNIGHSAQSFGQDWAYSEIIEWCEAKARAAQAELARLGKVGE